MRQTVGGVVFEIGPVSGSAAFDPSAEEFRGGGEPDIRVRLHRSHLASAIDPAGALHLRDGHHVVVMGKLPDGRYLIRWQVSEPHSPHATLIVDPSYAWAAAYLGRLPDRSAEGGGYAGIYRTLVSGWLSRRSGLLVHACGLNIATQSLIFPGSSGAGKTTLAELWNGSAYAQILNDENLVVRHWGGTWHAFGTPWSSDPRLRSSGHAPLTAIAFLTHANQNSLKRLTAGESAKRLLSQVFLPLWDAGDVARALASCADLCEAVPCFEFGFVPDQTAVSYLRAQIQWMKDS